MLKHRNGQNDPPPHYTILPKYIAFLIVRGAHYIVANFHTEHGIKFCHKELPPVENHIQVRSNPGHRCLSLFSAEPHNLDPLNLFSFDNDLSDGTYIRR